MYNWLASPFLSIGYSNHSADLVADVYLYIDKILFDNRVFVSLFECIILVIIVFFF
jgi:hypothetical protein